MTVPTVRHERLAKTGPTPGRPARRNGKYRRHADEDFGSYSVAIRYNEDPAVTLTEADVTNVLVINIFCDVACRCAPTATDILQRNR
jgi:hypothetical protein